MTLAQHVQILIDSIPKRVLFAEMSKRVPELIRERWKQGKKPDGTDIKFLPTRKGTADGVYDKQYKRYKSERGRQTSKVDLFLDGLLYEGVLGTPYDEGIEIIINDDGGKIKGLLNYYGEDVFAEFSEEDQDVLGTIFVEILIDELNKLPY